MTATSPNRWALWRIAGTIALCGCSTARSEPIGFDQDVGNDGSSSESGSPLAGDGFADGRAPIGSDSPDGYSGAGSVGIADGSDASNGDDGSRGSDASAAADASNGCADAFAGGPTPTTTAHLDISAHDPSIIWDGSRYYLFATNTLGVRLSSDLETWSNAGNYMTAVPTWVTAATSATGLWAPDVSYFNGSFHVYYSGSTFGANTSVIGLATTATLQGPNWVDQGLIVQSKSTDNFNAIDPNVGFDQNCTPWLSFGSSWSGIKMRKVDATTGKLAGNDTTLYSLASRNGGPIEAPSIVSHNGYYYLFVSFDACCKGINSTYRTMVGRARNITGPYVDKAGADMMQGAAEQLLTSSGRYIGPGGGTAMKNGNTYLYAFHYYDGQNSGASRLQIRPIMFDTNDWITLGNPLFP